MLWFCNHIFEKLLTEVKEDLLTGSQSFFGACPLIFVMFRSWMLFICVPTARNPASVKGADCKGEALRLINSCIDVITNYLSNQYPQIYNNINLVRSPIKGVLTHASDRVCLFWVWQLTKNFTILAKWSYPFPVKSSWVVEKCWTSNTTVAYIIHSFINE